MLTSLVIGNNCWDALIIEAVDDDHLLALGE